MPGIFDGRHLPVEALADMRGMPSPGHGGDFGPAIGMLGVVGRPVMDRMTIDDYARAIAAGLEDFAARGEGFGLSVDGEELVSELSRDLASELEDACLAAVDRVARQSVARYGVAEGLAAPRVRRLGSRGL